MEDELARLQGAGISFQRDDQEFKEGRLVLSLTTTLDGEPLELTARFPDLYPDFRFEIEAPNLDLEHHQNPFGKNLCLIGQATENWKPSDTLAGFIVDRIPIVLKTARTAVPEDAKDLEEAQAEPFGAYYGTYRDSCFLVDNGWAIDSATTFGQIKIGVEPDSSAALRGAILEVQDSRSRQLASLSLDVSVSFNKEIAGRWVRVQDPIREIEPDKFLAKLIELHPRLINWRPHPIKGLMVDVIGVVYPEESSWRQTSDAWIFLVRTRRPNLGQPTENCYLSRSIGVGQMDLAARIPEVSFLHDKKVAVVGLGCVGSPCVVELARCGVGELRILDNDVVEGGTVVRWPLGFEAVGKAKASALAEFLRKNYHATTVVPVVHRIGSAFLQPKPDREVLPSLLDGADLLLDAGAERGMSATLARLCAERNIPFVCISTTPGAWGGLLARIRPTITAGCWHCFLHGLNDGSIPSPPFDPSELIQPRGCASPTFTGASFDVQQISLAGARLVVSTLSSHVDGQYPDTDWDVGMISLRNPNGSLDWSLKTFQLVRHPKCENHPE